MSMARCRSAHGAHKTCLRAFPLQLDNETISVPKLYVVPIDKTLCLRDCFSIVGANQWLKSNEMPIISAGVGPIFRH
jgi:hypothetical protein